MKTLFIFRHAKSSWKYPELKDIDRPLNKRGKRDVIDMGQRLSKAGIHADIMLSSPANRAVSTALGIAKETQFEKSAIRIDERLYFAGVSGVFESLRELENKHEVVFCFGHNPTTEDFIRASTMDSIGHVPTCAVACIQFETDSWTNIDKNGKLIFFDFPKNVSA